MGKALKAVNCERDADRFSASTPGVSLRGHLLLKRFKDSEVTPGCLKARRATPYDAKVDLDKTGRASCVKCGKGIAKGLLRFTLMLQCHKGWKNSSHCHYECFFLHPEARKLVSPTEIDNLKSLPQADQQRVVADFSTMMVAKKGQQPPCGGGEGEGANGTQVAKRKASVAGDKGMQAGKRQRRGGK